MSDAAAKNLDAIQKAMVRHNGNRAQWRRDRGEDEASE